MSTFEEMFGETKAPMSEHQARLEALKHLVDVARQDMTNPPGPMGRMQAATNYERALEALYSFGTGEA